MGLFNYRRPMITISFIIIIGFTALLFLNHMDFAILIYGAVLLVALEIAYLVLCRMSMEDQYIFLIVAMLFSIGEIMLFRLDETFGRQQMLWFGVSLVCFFATYFLIIKTDVWERLGFLYFGGAILLFLITMLFGRTVSGARNWIYIGKFSIQTSEIIKLFVVFMLADRYTNPERYRLFGLSEGLVLSALVYAVLGCMVIQREWGTAVVIFLMHLSMMFIFGENKKIMLLNIGLAVVGGCLGAMFLTHIQTRIEVWLNPWSDMSGKGYQITQSLFAIGAGGFFGTGIGMGSPEYIPYVHTDFIFSAICEEFGILGGVAVIMLYFVLVYRGLRISMNIHDTFYKALSAAVTILLGFQSFIILGGVTKFIPLTGITMPFISYGGSSLLISFIAIGILEGAANKGHIVRKGEVMHEKESA